MRVQAHAHTCTHTQHPLKMWKMQINNVSENSYNNILVTYGLLININNGGYGLKWYHLKVSLNNCNQILFILWLNRYEDYIYIYQEAFLSKDNLFYF